MLSQTKPFVKHNFQVFSVGRGILKIRPITGLPCAKIWEKAAREQIAFVKKL